LLAALAIQVWVFAFLVFFGSEIVHLDPLLRVTAQVLFATPLAIWAIFRLRGPRDGLDRSILVALAIFAVVCLVSRDRLGSLETLGLVLVYVLLFWAMRDVAACVWVRDAFATGAATALAFSLALNAWLWIDEKLTAIANLGWPPRFEAFEVFPWETANVMPVLVLLAAPFIAWVPLRPVRVALWLVIGASALVLVPFSVGRAGWLAIAVAMVVLVLLRTSLLATLGRWLPNRTSRLVGGGALAVGVVGASLVVVGSVLRGLSESGRILLYQGSVAMFADRPLAGNGPGIYSWARLLYPPQGAHAIPVRLTHDVPLQTLADGGLLLASGMLLAIGAWVITAFRRRAAWGWHEHVAIAVLAGFALACLLDDFSFLPAVTALVVTLAAWLVGRDAVPEPARAVEGGWRLLIAPALVLLAVALAMPAVLAGDLSRNEALRARTAAETGDWAGAADHFRAAAALHPAHAGYRLGLGMALAYLGDPAGARAAYEAARELNPGDPRGAGGLAALTEDPAARLELIREAAAHTLGDPQFEYRLGLEEAASGDPSAAAEAFAHAVVLNPPLFGVLPYERAGVTRESVAEHVDEILAREQQAAPILDLVPRWDIGLALGDLPGDAGIEWRAVAAELAGNHGAADRAIAEAKVSNRLDARIYQAAAAVARLRCDMAGADEALRLESFTRNAYTPHPPTVRVARELVYREAGLVGTQPPQAEPPPSLDRWPWPLIGPPPQCVDGQPVSRRP
jgi:tetratricopeptide (TPR) repeat protein